jgi:hypothetical protein
VAKKARTDPSTDASTSFLTITLSLLPPKQASLIAPPPPEGQMDFDLLSGKTDRQAPSRKRFALSKEEKFDIGRAPRGSLEGGGASLCSYSPSNPASKEMSILFSGLR